MNFNFKVMNTIEVNIKKGMDYAESVSLPIILRKCLKSTCFGVVSAIFAIAFTSLFAQCTKDDNAPKDVDDSTVNDKYTIDQTISDEAQKNTLSFEGLAFLP